MIVDFEAARARKRAEAAGNPVTTAYLTGYAEEGAYNTTAAATERARAWVRAYTRVWAREPDDLERADVAYYMGRGMAEAVIVAAIGAARDAPRPTWRYAVAVMARCSREGVMTAEAYARRSRAHAEKSQKQQQKQVPAQTYTQRNYAPGELDYLIERI